MPDPIVDGEAGGGFTDTPDTTAIGATARGGGGGSGSGTTTTTTSLTGSSSGGSTTTTNQPYNETTVQSLPGASTTSGSTSTGTTTTSYGGCNCCNPCSVIDLLGPNGCNTTETENRYCVRFYNFRGGTGFCFPSEMTFEVAHVTVPLPGTSNCNSFEYIPGTYEPATDAGCSGYTFDPSNLFAPRFSIYWVSFLSKFTLSMQGPNFQINDGSSTHTVRFWSPASSYNSEPITTCSPLLITWTYCQVRSDYYTVFGFRYFDMDFYTCPSLGTMPKTNRIELPCVNMTATPIDRANCNCPEKFVYGCSLHGQCRPNSDLGDGIRSCQTCQDYEEV